MSPADLKRRVTSLSRWQVFTFGAVTTSVTGLGVYAYYQKLYLPELRRDEYKRSMPLPKRRTRLYVAGSSTGEGLLPEKRSMPVVIFYGYAAYRMILLFVRCIPVLWYGFLTFGLGLCPEKFFYNQIVDFLSSMGPSYTKLGQWMATRPDFFPDEMCATLEKLYDRTEPHGWAHTEKLLRTPFKIGPFQGKNALRFISEVEKVPINSGSIAQVHRAKLRESIDGVPAGTELALKVTHPHIREQVAADLVAMRLFVSIGNRLIPGLKYFNLDSSINEFSSLIRSQLNLLVEGDNLLQFKYNFRDVNGIIFPTPLSSLSSEDVLFETFESGKPLQEVPTCEENHDIAELGCHMFLKMLFEDNFVHSDLHPGNVLIRTNNVDGTRQYYPDGKRKLHREIVVLDTGLVTTLSKEERDNFISLFAAVACGDGELGAELMMDRLPESMKTPQNTENHDRFKREMKAVFDLVAPGTSGFRLSKIQIGSVLGKVMSTVRENRMPLDGNFASLVLTVIVGEGLGRKLSPDFNIFAEAAPYLMTFLEGQELYFLANKLQGTYGATALLRDSVSMVQPRRAATFAELGAKKTSSILRRLFAPEAVREQGISAAYPSMPILTKSMKKKKKTGSRGAKKSTIVATADPDATYKEQLNGVFYVSQSARVKFSSRYTTLIDTAIRASIFSPSSPSSEQVPVPQQIHLVKVPEIVRSLGLCATDDQMSQICAMIFDDSVVSADEIDVSSPDHGLHDTQGSANTERLRRVLSEAMETHILAYDPQGLLRPDQRFPTKLSSVLYSASQQDVRDSFESLWKATGEKVSVAGDGASVRYFTTAELEAILSNAQHETHGVLPLTKKELGDLYYFVKDDDEDVIREDRFLNAFAHVN